MDDDPFLNTSEYKTGFHSTSMILPGSVVRVVVRHLLLVAMPLLLVASSYY